jgi:hypothetical protein
VDWPAIGSFLDNKAALSALSAAGGALLTKLFALYRERLKVLEYTVTHDRVGLSAQDAIFGEVRVTWEGHELRNLYASTLVLENTASADYTNLKLKVYTGNTLLLNERSEIAGTTHIAPWTDEFRQSLQVAGDAPTDAQLYAFRHGREYMLPVFNRGQRLVLTYLTTVPNADEGPSVWLDMLHPGVQLVFRPVTQQIYGVPVRLALPLGLFACVVVLTAVSVYVRQPWLASVILLASGLAVQAIGAGVYRLLRLLKKAVTK